MSSLYKTGTCRITFLPLNSANEIGKKGKFQKLFHCAFFSNRYILIPIIVVSHFIDRVLCQLFIIILHLPNIIILFPCAPINNTSID